MTRICKIPVQLSTDGASLTAELEHIHRGFVKASRQYVQMTQPQPQQPVMQPPGELSSSQVLTATDDFS